MKRILLLIMTTMLFATSAHALILGSSYSNSVDATGTPTYKDKVFIQVLAGEALVAGDCVYYDVTADNGITVKKVAASAQATMPACIVEKAIASGKMGKCQTFGYSNVVLFDAATTAVAGEPIYCGSGTAGRVIAIASGSVAAYNIPVGQFLDADSASGSIEAFVNTL